MTNNSSANVESSLSTEAPKNGVERDPFKDVIDEQFNYLENLRLASAENLKNECCLILREIRDKIKSQTRFREVQKLIPVVAYLFLKSKGYEVKKSDMMRSANITKREFTNRLKFIVLIYPEYTNRDRKRIILEKLQRIMDCFNIRTDEFDSTCLELFRIFGGRLKTTTESIAAGVICILTLYKLGLEKPTCNNVCKFLRIEDSAILYNLKKKIFPSVRLNGVVGSRELIRKLLITCPVAASTNVVKF